jgi:hypothetical protein
MVNRIRRRLEHIKTAAFRIARDKPGRRFENYHDRTRHQLQEHPVRTVSMYVIAALLISAGFLFGFIPGIPGIVLGLPGLALIAARSRFFAALLDRGEMAIRGLLRRLVREN